MFNRLTNLFFIMVFIAGLGCGTTSSVRKFDTPSGSQLDKGLDDIVFQMSNQIPASKKPVKIFITEFVNLDNQNSDLERYLIEKFTTKLATASEFKVLESGQLNKVLSQLRIKLSELTDPLFRKEFGEQSGADAIFDGTTQEFKSQKVVRINTRLVDIKTEDEIATFGIDIEKDKQVMRLLGEKLPGQLIVLTHPKDTEVYLNSELAGKTSSGGLVVEIPYGSHSIRIDKSGFRSFTKQIFMEEDNYKKLEVKFEADEAAPFKCFFTNAILPGWGLALYGKSKLEKGSDFSNAGAWNFLSIFGFYTVGVFFAVDELAKKDNFLTERQKERYDTIKDVEFKTMLGLYAVNLLTSFAVGSDYSKRNRTAKEVEYTEMQKKFSFNPTIINNNQQIGVGFTWAFHF